MPVLTFTGTDLDLRLQAGDDVRARFTFDNDLTGWTGWLARVRGDDTTWDFAIDDSAQGSQEIVATLTHTQTSAMFHVGPLHWQFKCVDGLGEKHTLFSGRVTVAKDEE